MQIPTPNANETHGTVPDRFLASEEMGTFATSLTSLTNCEVWERTESAMLQLAPDLDSTLQDWLRIEALLDELRWRLSGLEGAGSPLTQLAVTVRGGQRE